VDPEQRLARERPAEPVAQELVKRPDAERPNPNALDSVSADRLVQTERLRLVDRSPRQQDTNIVCAEAAKRERERARRRGVEPLDVVDGDHERFAIAEQLENVAHRDGERALIDAIALRVGSQHYHLEGTPSRRCERGQRIVERGVEEVAEPYVSERSLRLSRARRENSQAPRARMLDGGKPERRLPDPRIAVEHEYRGAALDLIDERANGGELCLSADDSEWLRLAQPCSRISS
jgi:hypothetical protein